MNKPSRTKTADPDRIQLQAQIDEARALAESRLAIIAQQETRILNLERSLAEARQANEALREVIAANDTRKTAANTTSDAPKDLMAEEMVNLRRRLHDAVCARETFELRLAAAEQSLLGFAYRLGGQEIDDLHDISQQQGKMRADEEVPLA